jgi:hypothetical protein
MINRSWCPVRDSGSRKQLEINRIGHGSITVVVQMAMISGIIIPTHWSGMIWIADSRFEIYTYSLLIARHHGTPTEQPTPLSAQFQLSTPVAGLDGTGLSARRRY